MKFSINDLITKWDVKRASRTRLPKEGIFLDLNPTQEMYAPKIDAYIIENGTLTFVKQIFWERLDSHFDVLNQNSANFYIAIQICTDIRSDITNISEYPQIYLSTKLLNAISKGNIFDDFAYWELEGHTIEW